MHTHVHRATRAHTHTHNGQHNKSDKFMSRSRACGDPFPRRRYTIGIGRDRRRGRNPCKTPPAAVETSSFVGRVGSSLARLDPPAHKLPLFLSLHTPPPHRRASRHRLSALLSHTGPAATTPYHPFLPLIPQKDPGHIRGAQFFGNYHIGLAGIHWYIRTTTTTTTTTTTVYIYTYIVYTVVCPRNS